MGYSWIAVEALTGKVIADLPDLTVDSVIQTIGRYESATASLPLPTAPTNWQRATLEGATCMVLLSQPTDSFGNQIGNPVPVWGAMVTVRNLDHTDVVQMTLATLEAYLDRQFIGNKTYAATGQNDIINDLITSYVGASVGGIPIRVQYVTAGSGTVRARTYADQDDKTVYSALTDLMGVVGGPEWYIGWEHQSSPERYTPVLYVGDRIGTAATVGMSPAATFDMPGPVTAFQMVRDYSAGKGATSVIATSSGQGTLRPQSPPQTVVDTQRPKFEYRFTPSTSIIDTPTLVTWAQASLAQQDTGTVTLTVSAAADYAPQLGTDWFLGDDIGFNIGGLDGNGVDTVPAFPGGFTGTGRAIGYTLTLGETPIITPALFGAQIF